MSVLPVPLNTADVTGHANLIDGMWEVGLVDFDWECVHATAAGGKGSLPASALGGRPWWNVYIWGLEPREAVME